MHRKAPLRSKGEWCQGIFYPYAFLVESILAKRWVGESWDISDMNSESGKSKWLVRGKPEEIVDKNNSNCHEGMIQWLFLCLSLPMYLSKDIVLFFFLINTLLVLLLSVFAGILFMQSRRARTLLLTIDLAARNGALTTVTQPQSLAGGLKPCFKLLQAKATRDYYLPK